MIRRENLGYNGGTPKDEIDTCLNCPLVKPMCESESCPLVIKRLARRKDRGRKKHDRQGTDRGAESHGEQKQTALLDEAAARLEELTDEE